MTGHQTTRRSTGDAEMRRRTNGRRHPSSDLRRFVTFSTWRKGRGGCVRPRFIRPVCRFRLHLRNAFGRRHSKMITTRKGSRGGEETPENKARKFATKPPLDKTESVNPLFFEYFTPSLPVQCSKQMNIMGKMFLLFFQKTTT